MLFSILNDMKRLTFKRHKSGYYYYYSVKWYDYDEIDSYPAIPIPIKITEDGTSYQFLKINGQWSRAHKFLHFGGSLEDVMLGRFVLPSIIDYMDRHQVYFLRLKAQRKYVVIKEDTPERTISAEVQCPKYPHSRKTQLEIEKEYEEDHSDFEDYDEDF